MPSKDYLIQRLARDWEKHIATLRFSNYSQKLGYSVWHTTPAVKRNKEGELIP